MHDFPEADETHGFYGRTDLSPAWSSDGGGPRAWEVTISELDRNASRVLHRVSKAGDVAAITRHGLAVALIVPLNDAVSLLPSEYVMSADLGAISAQLTERSRRRYSAAIQHARTRRGRWPRRR
jgi:antitoxin (DNA-binding transcriptional repressor) of toxin-antitoxin stability system